MSLDESHPFFGLMNVSQRVLRWDEIRKAVAYWKAREEVARRDLFAEVFPGRNDGTDNFELGGGYKLKGTGNLNYSLPSKENSKDVRGVAARIAELTKQSDPTLADRLFRWSAELSLSEYKKLEIGAPVSKALGEVLTIKPGLPTLEIVIPKGAK